MSPLYPLLGLLAQGERHGYELKSIIDQEFAPFWRIDYGQLYRSLARLTREGWVKARAEAGAAGPRRKVYRLTASGRQVFRRWLAQPAHHRTEFLVKLRLAQQQNAPIDRLIESQRRTFANQYAERVRAHQKAREVGDPGHLIITDAALRETEAALAALDFSAMQFKLVAPSDSPLEITGSDDPLLSRLAQIARVSVHPVGSINGLVALAQHRTDIAGIHLLDVETGEYNSPYIKHLAPEEEIVLVNLAVRQNGLVLAPGNPKKIRGLSDLSRRGIRMVNRQRGAGTRLWLYSRLRAARISPASVRDWDRVEATHDAVAAFVARGQADAGPGLCAVAAQWNLEFILLGEERFDLAIPRAIFDSPRVQSLLHLLTTSAFRRTGADLQGYDLSRTGRVVARVK